MSMKDFYTREVSNEGIEMPLYLPGTNTKSQHWLRIIGTDSDTFRLKNIEMKRKGFKIMELPEEKRDQAELDAKRELVASLVVDWSFTEECNLKNVMDFFHNAPHIQEAVNTIAAQRSLFFAKPSSVSENTPDASSN